MNSPAFAASDYGMRTPRVLSIDDSELMHRLLRARLQLEQVELHSSTSGEEGLRMALALKPDVILLDIEMPDMDGITALPLLLQKHPAATVIVASTLTTRKAHFGARTI
jgi:two-component system chemotaxis response regulator CheB